MHPLTKVFIVVQALLSVLVAALTIPLAVNEDTWLQRYQTKNAEAQTAKARADHNARQMEAISLAGEKEVASLNQQMAQLRGQLADKELDGASLRADLASARHESASVKAELSTLTASNETLTNIVNAYSQEIQQRRTDSVAIQRRQTELEDQLRDTLATLDVSVDAQRILQEQLAQTQRDIEQLRVLAANAPRQGPGSIGAPTEPIVPAPNIEGRVLNVKTGPSGVKFAEIDLGQRDGIAPNMKFIIHRNGLFQGNLIITTVDINRAVGRIELEQDSVLINDRVRGAGTRTTS